MPRIKWRGPISEANGEAAVYAADLPLYTERSEEREIDGRATKFKVTAAMPQDFPCRLQSAVTRLQSQHACQSPYKKINSTNQKYLITELILSQIH